MTPPPAPPPAPTDAERRLNASIDYWKRSLLDLTHRNRALNFKPARVSTIVIVDEQPAEVFRELCLNRGSMKFKPAPAPVADSTAAPATAAPPPDAALSAAPGPATPAAPAQPVDTASLPIDVTQPVSSSPA